ncbi:conserved hypothetical protein [Saccharophagus degradans 2-40]|uniref:Uncharacterized protein n=2 Tax=Saccharophagus degradans TaxID=86304 RepID=Q21E50_SACD2|nr:conserved hypothetical protein [Saccharophagus degradans 2-40]
MWKKEPIYELNDPVTKISDHRNLPIGCEVLASFKRSESSCIIFTKNNGFLSILDMTDRIKKDGTPVYICAQTDVTFKFLDWFPRALNDFVRPPAEGGLHAGAMITQDEDVEGEMLCIVRISIPSGYEVMNRSRCNWGFLESNTFMEQSVEFEDDVLFDGGMLKWMESGEWKALI